MHEAIRNMYYLKATIFVQLSDITTLSQAISLFISYCFGHFVQLGQIILCFYLGSRWNIN